MIDNNIKEPELIRAGSEITIDKK